MRQPRAKLPDQALWIVGGWESMTVLEQYVRAMESEDAMSAKWAWADGSGVRQADRQGVKISPRAVPLCPRRQRPFGERGGALRTVGQVHFERAGAAKAISCAATGSWKPRPV